MTCYINKRIRTPNFSKKVNARHCKICLEKRGLINTFSMGSWYICRKCLYDGISHTNYVSQ